MFKKRKIAASALASAAATGVLMIATASSAHADGQFAQTADPAMYCYDNPPFQLQVSQAGWQVYSGGRYTGTIGQNNMQCEYDVSVPLPYDNEHSYTLPPFRFYTKVDWNLMCAQQFPGSTLAWTPGPVNPGWHCMTS